MNCDLHLPELHCASLCDIAHLLRVLCALPKRVDERRPILIDGLLTGMPFSRIRRQVENRIMLNDKDSNRSCALLLIAT